MTRAATTSVSSSQFQDRLRRFWKLSLFQKYVRAGQHLRRFWPSLPIPIRLPFGAWWIVRNSALDYELLTTGFETAEIRFVQRFLRPGMTVLDVGAHHGLYTLLASRLVGNQGKVVAFEPSPRERLRLEKHMRLNRAHNIEIKPFALGAESGEAELYLADGSDDWCNSLRRPLESSGRTVRVQVKRLDDVAANARLAKVDFLKLDVEGAELEALKGAGILLNRAPRPVVLAEVYDIRTKPFGYEAREIVRFLSTLNYQWFALNENGTLAKIPSNSQSYDANLVAVPPESVNDVQKSLGEE